MDGTGRRLAAIMFTDVAGYTALAQRDERLALELLEEHRTLIRPLIGHCEGVEVKTMGDGFLIEFPSALQAVRCAVEVQRALRAHASTQPATRTLRVRIGVHLGDVERREGDILGDGVNIASRIMPLAEPGGICVSRQVYDQVENKLEVKFACLGPQTLKHIARPVEVYRVVHPWEEPPPRKQPEGQPRKEKPSRPSKPSVAVLPFANVSTDPDNECFCDGLTEDILAQLATIGSLKVISRTSVMRYKKTDKPLREIADELGVATILEGTARKVENRVRIVAQLIRAEDDDHLWAKTYDRNLTDIFEIQSEVAQEIARALKATITGAERARIEKQPTKSLEAYNLVLQARFDLNIFPWTKERIEQAIQTLQRAIELDPDYALAHSVLADAYRYMARFSWESRETAEEFVAKSEGAVRRALELDDTLPEAHYAAGSLAVRRLNWTEAERSYQRALELNPNSASAHHRYAFLLSYHGRHDEALEHMLRARELDPSSIHVWIGLGFVLGYARQYGQLLEEAQELFRRFPDAARYMHWEFGWTLFYLGRYEEAWAEFKLFKERAPEFESKDCVVEIHLAMVEERLGQQGVLRETLERWEAEPDTRKVHPGAMAVGHVLSGDQERALDWLESGYERNPPDLVTMKVGPVLDPLHGHPRFQTLLAKLGLADPP